MRLRLSSHYNIVNIRQYSVAIGQQRPNSLEQQPTLPLSLLNHADKGFFISLGRIDLLQIKSFGFVSLDSVKRPKNQTLHLQLVYVVQLGFNT